MIIDIFFMLIGGLLYALGTFFNSIPYIQNPEITNSIIYFFSFTDYARPFVDVDTLLNAIGVLMSFIIIFYSVKLVLFIWSLIPFFGKKVDLPNFQNQAGETHISNREWSKAVSDTKYRKGRY